jgi:hypothetical protein
VLSHKELVQKLDEWIAEGGEIAKVARLRKARLATCHQDTEILRAEVNNIARYFGKENR